MSILNKLTEGIVSRDLKKEGDALLGKWEKTGLLEGIDNDVKKQGMARLLENQAAQLLKEASSMAGGSVEGFASVAFPLVRRVFGGLLANDIVSVQPMSLPSGLIFFMDFTFDGTFEDSSESRLGLEQGDSIYGGGTVAAGLTGGVSLTGESGEDSFYNLNQGYSSATGSSDAARSIWIVASGTFGGSGTALDDGDMTNAEFDRFLRYDPDFIRGTTTAVISKLGSPRDLSHTPSGSTVLSQLNDDNLIAISGAFDTSGDGGVMARRLTQWSGSTANTRVPWTQGDPKTDVLFVHVSVNGTRTAVQLSESVDHTSTALAAGELSWPQKDNFQASNAVGSVVGDASWGLENETNIPEIAIKVDSVAVTAVTKKLKAKWTPELGQDLNAYHNLDAEVELTSILSEQIALEIDREILNDLVVGATAGKYYWSRNPGQFLRRDTGAEIGATSAAPDFTGTVSEWYETLIETINDISAQIHRKTLRGGANFVVVSPEVANVLEFTSGFRASITADSDRGTVGAIKTGSISKKWDVFVDPYFPRNVVLVGRKGGSFLESGYVYAPYVPLQVTPTIFGVEDFVPRKGVMTRYAKKMVRPDMYGIVIVRGLLGSSGA
jgi:hypothetical protein